MPTSSILKNFVISDKEDVEAFADALEEAFNTELPPIPIVGKQVTDREEIKQLTKRLKNRNGVIDLRERDTNDTKADTNDTKVDTKLIKKLF